MTAAITYVNIVTIEHVKMDVSLSFDINTEYKINYCSYNHTYSFL